MRVCSKVFPLSTAGQPRRRYYLRYSLVCSTVRLFSHSTSSLSRYKIRPPTRVNFGPDPAHRQLASVLMDTLPLYLRDTSEGVRYC